MGGPVRHNFKPPFGSVHPSADLSSPKPQPDASTIECTTQADARGRHRDANAPEQNEVLGSVDLCVSCSVLPRQSGDSSILQIVLASGHCLHTDAVTVVVATTGCRPYQLSK